MSEGHDLIIYQFSRSKVERCDFRHFLSLYGLEQLPTGRKLRKMMGAFEFCVEGYDDDPREIHSIPEVRRFYAAFHEAWPYWLYFGNLESDTLKTMILCCLPNLTATKVDGRATVGVQFDPLELVRFIGRDFVPMNLICERGQIDEQEIYDRSRAVLAYFDLPFDAESPPWCGRSDPDGCHGFSCDGSSRAVMVEGQTPRPSPRFSMVSIQAVRGNPRELRESRTGRGCGTPPLFGGLLGGRRKGARFLGL